MKISLIALDMDGTFLDDEKHIPEENRRALEECARCGIEIVPATGRTISGILDIMEKMPAVRYVIATNGALVMDLKENRLISTCRLSAELASQIMRMARESQDDIMYDAYIDGIGYTMDCFFQNLEQYTPNPKIAELVRKTRRSVPDNIAYIEEGGKEVEKINLFFRSEEARQRMRQQLASIPGILVCSSIASNLEINAAGADKGGALVRLAEYLGISQAETMAFGDGENDLTMIRMAGLGVAMANGEESVKAEADYVTAANNEAGVAAAIRQLVLR